jgi:hypothetical protein
VTALAAATGLFVVLANGDDGRTDSGTQPRRAQAATGDQSHAHSTTIEMQSAPGTTGDEPPDAQTPTIDRIVVRGGKPVGGVERLEYESGERVRFSVHSDMADEVHVHGFDISKHVPANGSVRFRFLADIEGVFEVELEDSHVKIAELRIEP